MIPTQSAIARGCLPGLVLCAALWADSGRAQGTPQAAAPQNAVPRNAAPQGAGAAPSAPAVPTEEAAAPTAEPKNAYEAYEAGLYDRALADFMDRQVERPKDPELQLNIGASHYQMRNFEEAERAFAHAALAADPALRAEALYNLGNVAYRQGQLEEAVTRYQRSLELNPDDEDAKFNLEFVRDEIRRRIEEQEKRQQEQQQQEQQGEEGNEPQDQDQDGQNPGEQNSQESGDPGEDQDQDGLPDDTERSASNPTDPANPDTDGDGLPDGQEDRNQNGRVDPGETDPNRQDSDGDGVPDGQEAREPQQEPREEPRQQAEGSAAQAEPTEEMSQEEAERYLQALEEGLPQQRRKAPKGRRGKPLKDW